MDELLPRQLYIMSKDYKYPSIAAHRSVLVLQESCPSMAEISWLMLLSELYIFTNRWYHFQGTSQQPASKRRVARECPVVSSYENIWTKGQSLAFSSIYLIP